MTNDRRTIRESLMTTQTTLLRLPKVMSRVGYAKPTIYAKIQEGTFPKPVKIGPRAVAWPESAIESWIQEQIEKSGAVNAG